MTSTVNDQQTPIMKALSELDKIKDGEFEQTVFKLINQTALDELVVFINNKEAPYQWRYPYRSMYSAAIQTGDDEFARSLISSVSLDADYNSGWTDIWHLIAKNCLELNMPKSFTALCNKMKMCKTELSMLKEKLAPFNTIQL